MSTPQRPVLLLEVSSAQWNELHLDVSALLRHVLLLEVSTTEACAAPGGVYTSNGNASETKANESFDNGVFFDIKAKRTPSIVSKLFSKRSEHIR